MAGQVSSTKNGSSSPGTKGPLQGAGLKQLMVQKKGNRNMNSMIGFNKKRHKTPLTNVHKSAQNYVQSKEAQSPGIGGKTWHNQQLYDPVGQVKFTQQKINAHFVPVQRATGSRVFGDKLEDYQELAKRLGDFRLNRLKANELNIYARGSVTGVRAHLNLLRTSTNAYGAQENLSDLNLIDCLTGPSG